MVGISTNIFNGFTKAQYIVWDLFEFIHKLGRDHNVWLFCVGLASGLVGPSHGVGSYCLLW